MNPLEQQVSQRIQPIRQAVRDLFRGQLDQVLSQFRGCRSPLRQAIRQLLFHQPTPLNEEEKQAENGKRVRIFDV